MDLYKLPVLLILLSVATAPGALPQKHTLYFFYAPSCPHCSNLETFFKMNGIYGEYDVRRINAVENLRLFQDLSDTYGIPGNLRDEVPVVFVLNSSTYCVTDTECIRLFKDGLEKIGPENETEKKLARELLPTNVLFVMRWSLDLFAGLGGFIDRLSPECPSCLI
ncbi:MAG: hypothetical protein JXB14_02275 [Candidatus Altiarchaeota archaeon]|nr:hypothetical protein [Candidatus Altiarchaeota archaeon]